MEPLTHTQVQDACSRILKNAKGLLSDAKLLARHNRFPRAFALCVLALEECAKIPMLRAIPARGLRAKMDWDNLGRRLRSHNQKLAIYDLVSFIDADSLRGTDTEIDVRMRNRGRHSEAVKTGNRQKQSGFYVNIGPERSESPEDAIAPELALQVLAATKAIVARFEHSDPRRPLKRATSSIDPLTLFEWQLKISLADLYESKRK
jgi:AbiV family abortive infection protein